MKQTLLTTVTGIMAMLAQPLSAGGTIEKVDAHVNEVASDTTITLQEVAVRANFADEHETALSLTTTLRHASQLCGDDARRARRVCHLLDGDIRRRNAEYARI